MKNITFEKVKELFKKSIDESNNMEETLSRLVDYIWIDGYEHCRSEMVESIEDATKK